MAAVSEQEIHRFVDDLFAGKFSDLSEYIKAELSQGAGLCQYNGVYEQYLENSINDETNDFYYYLITSCFALRRFDIVSYYMEQDITFFNERLFTANMDFSEALEFLLSKGIVFDYDDIIDDCCVSGNLAMLKYIVEQKGHIPKQSHPRFDFFKRALYECQYKIMEYLVYNLGFDVNYKPYLHKANRRNDRRKLVPFLLNLGADKDLKDEDGRTADCVDSDPETGMMILTYEPLPELKEPDEDYY